MKTTPLTTSEACAILIKGGHITESFFTRYKRPYYSVHSELGRVGRITQKQFYEMNEADLIVCYESRTDKYGNTHNFFKICTSFSMIVTI